MGESLDDEVCYGVVIHEMLDEEVQLQHGGSKLRELMLGDFTDWPKYSTFPC